MRYEEFVEQWRSTLLGERQSYQIHFNNLCDLVGYERPSASGKDKHSNKFVFEQHGEGGFADVWLQGHFAIEYKAPQNQKKHRQHKDLTAAYNQLLRYREQLENPLLLVVTDIDHWEIHTNFPNSVKRVYKFTNEEIASSQSVQKWLRYLFYSPEQLNPKLTVEAVTLEAARGFTAIVEHMRGSIPPERIAQFLAKLVFCLFSEGIGLLPTVLHGERGIFTEIVSQVRREPERFIRYIHDLFEAMADGGEMMLRPILHFNGALFADATVERLEIDALTDLWTATTKNWGSLEPAIFGNLFEGVLEGDKRAQRGTYYTDRADIIKIIKPVLLQPLEHKWEEIRKQAEVLQSRLASARTQREKQEIKDTLGTLRQTMVESLRKTTVLDPACGSGNFLYISLQSLMDLEKLVITDPVFKDLDAQMPQVHPSQMYGIEIDPIAHALSSIVVWIGYIQWRQHNGYGQLFTDGKAILSDLSSNIRHMDAIFDVETNTEPEWPAADVIVGNPPFIGDKLMKRRLGVPYVTNLRNLYRNRIPGGADLVTYWFEKARAQIEAGKTKRAGLIATKSIRQGKNRKILERIEETGSIFMAYPDAKWRLKSAAVRVAMVGFDDGSEEYKTINDNAVTAINADLTQGLDTTRALKLSENDNLAFIGTQKGGDFDISAKKAKEMLDASPENAQIVRPWLNSKNIVDEPKSMWIIDFGAYMSQEDAAKYQLPFAYVREKVFPQRENLTRSNHKEKWWIHAEARPGLREAIKDLPRYILTPRVAKHRIFVWVDRAIVPDSRLIAIARDDDYFFGVLHSLIHELWSLKKASSHGVGNDPTYNAESCFQTFPFPYIPGQEPMDDPCYQAIAQAAKQLHEEREKWLKNSGGTSNERTLTNLYNSLVAERGLDPKAPLVAAAQEFAPHLKVLHDTLDKAVCAAYGWDISTLDNKDEIVSKLLALNLKHASS